MSRKVILYIAMSLDGFITKPNEDLSFLTCVEKTGEDYGYADFISTIDTVILGRKTYDWVMRQVSAFPHEDKNTFVITRTEKPSIGKTCFYTGNIAVLITQLKQETGKHIFCDGGAEIVNELLKEKLLDELIIFIIPILVGDGIKLFQKTIPKTALKLLSIRSFETGLVQLHYQCVI